MKKNLSLILLILSLIFSSPLKAFAFTDIPLDSPYFQAVEFLSQKKAVEDIGGEKFNPDQIITQKEFIKSILALFGFNPTMEKNKSTTDLKCKNLPEKSPFYPYFQKAADLKIIQNSIETCDADKNLSKIQALRVIFNLNNIPIPKVYGLDTSPVDINQKAWFAPLASHSLKIGLIELDDKKRFLPFKKISKGESAELLYRTYNYLYPEEAPPIQIQFIPVSSPGNNLSFEDIPRSRLLFDILKNIQNKYYFSEKDQINSKNIVDKTIKGLTSQLNDPFTAYINSDDAKIFESSLSGDFEGIGAQLIQNNNKETVIINVFKNTPAEKSGLRPLDIIKQIDGQSVEGLTLDQITQKIRGPKETTVKIKISRPSSNETLEFPVVRNTINLPSIQVNQLEGNILHVELNVFGENTAEDFDKIIKENISGQTKGIIIDLRNNPGGILDVVNNMLSHFVPEGKAVSHIKDRNNEIETLNSSGPNDLSKFPIVVLINEGSASASEIFASAIQDYKIGIIVGKKSYGKGTVQELITYEDNSILKLTVAEWLSPLQKSIEKIGVKPDIEIDLTQADRQNNLDPQLAKAIEVLKTR